jgi:hypothetical protein
MAVLKRCTQILCGNNCRFPTHLKWEWKFRHKYKRSGTTMGVFLSRQSRDASDVMGVHRLDT